MAKPGNTMRAGDGDRRHGTNGGYTNHGCRCRRCTAAHRRELRRYRSTTFERQFCSVGDECPRDADTSGGVADTFRGGIDMEERTRAVKGGAT